VAKAPTDLEILNAIYNRYYGEFALLSEDKPARDAKIYVPIDCKAIAKDLGIDPDIVFGRLYYDLEKRYGYKQDNGAAVDFFAFQVGNDRKAINFPYLASVVANLRAVNRKQWTATIIAIVSISIAFIALVISIYGTFFMRAVA
jgi:hypothetical protein